MRKKIHKWTDEEIAFLKSNYKKRQYKEIAGALGLTRSHILNKLRSLGLRLPEREYSKRMKQSQFSKGALPWNKNLRGYMGKNKTSFKKGNLPANTLYDGAVTIRIDNDTGISYKWIRLGQNKWRELHRHIWEKRYGKVPKGFVLRFKDGNSMNVTLNNIELISRSAHLKKNKPQDLYTNTMNYRINSDRYICRLLGICDRKLQQKIIKDHYNIIELKRLELKLNAEYKNAS